MLHSNPFIQRFLELYQLSEEKARKLMNPSKEDVRDVYALSGANDFLKHLYALKDKHITIVPDYDPDGILSGSILYYSLACFKGFDHVELFKPITSTGFGLSPASLDLVLKAYPETEVILTTDNGIMAHEAVKLANERELTVLITDHHLGASKNPEALAIVNPNQVGDRYPFKSICGTTVIWKLMLEYARKVEPKTYNMIESMLVFVGIASVSDVMELLDENRYFVKETLERLNNPGWVSTRAAFPSPVAPFFRGLYALMNVLAQHNKVWNDTYNAETIGFYISPILNAPRRVTGESALGFDLFMQSSFDDALKVAEELYALNEERKEVTKELVASIDRLSRAEGQVIDLPMTGGYSGLVAGRVQNELNQPVIALAQSDRAVWSGSARSPEWYPLSERLGVLQNQYPDVIAYFGGHSQAAGLGIYKTKVNVFRQIFEADATVYYDQLEKVEPSLDDLFLLTLDGFGKGLRVEDKDALLAFLDYLSQLEPFGHGFPKPTLYILFNMGDLAFSQMGKNQNHYKWFDSTSGLSLIYWNGAEKLDSSLLHDVVLGKGMLQINEFRGERHPQFILESVEPVLKKS